VTLIGPYLVGKPPKSLIFAPRKGDFFNPYSWNSQGLCAASLHIRLKFGKIRFINQVFITEKPRVGHFCPKFREPLAQKLGVGSQKLSMEKWYRGPLSICQVWWRSVYARRRENENKSFCASFLFATLGVACFGLADLPRCGILTKYSFAIYWSSFTVFGAFLEEETVWNGLRQFSLKLAKILKRFQNLAEKFVRTTSTIYKQSINKSSISTL